MGLLSQIADKQGEIFCGGRHHLYFGLFNKFFNELKGCSARLVFFSDLNVQKSKVDEWLDRRDKEYIKTVNLFNQIEEGKSVREIIAARDDQISIITAKHALIKAAKENGQHFSATQHECDAEVAKYACDHKALAVIANDTDYLIFEGDWQYWSAKDIDFETLNTCKYNRKGLCENLSLSYHQLPLWATLLQNDFIKSQCYYYELRGFYRSLGKVEERFQNVAKYVRSLKQSTLELTSSDIKKIGERVFGPGCNEEKRRAISDSTM